MSHDDHDLGFYQKYIQPWLHTPGTYANDHEEHEFKERDNIWSDFHIFDNEWIEIQNRKEWYESPNVPGIYADHKYIFKQNMDMGRPEEMYYKQNVDTGEFRSKMYVDEKLPSGKGDLRIKTRIRTKNAPSGENNFAMVEYYVYTYIKYKMPGGVTSLPRFLAYPLNRFFKWAFLGYIGEELVDRDGEYAREKTTEYFQYLRKYHGEEPIQTKTRQAEFKPMPEEGTFFE